MVRARTKSFAPDDARPEQRASTSNAVPDAVLSQREFLIQERKAELGRIFNRHDSLVRVPPFIPRAPSFTKSRYCTHRSANNSCSKITDSCFFMTLRFVVNLCSCDFFFQFGVLTNEQVAKQDQTNEFLQVRYFWYQSILSKAMH